MKRFANVTSMLLIAVIAVSLFSAAKVYEQARASHDGIESNVANIDHALAVLKGEVPQAVPDAKAQLEVKAPELADVGTLVEIDATDSIADSIKWHVSPGDQWKVVEGGRKVYVTSGSPQDYTITVAAALNGTVDLKVFHVTFGTPKPVAPPEPVKPLDPFAAAISDAASKVAVTDPVVKNEVLNKLSGNFSSIASMVAAGVIKTPEELIEATHKINKTVLGSDEDKWKPLTEAVRAELNKRAEAGTLKDLKQHETVWREIADILKNAAPV